MEFRIIRRRTLFFQTLYGERTIDKPTQSQTYSLELLEEDRTSNGKVLI